MKSHEIFHTFKQVSFTKKEKEVNILKNIKNTYNYGGGDMI